MISPACGHFLDDLDRDLSSLWAFPPEGAKLSVKVGGWTREGVRFLFLGVFQHVDPSF